MAITTRLQTKYFLQKVFIIVICLVMGLWGVYDYLYKIPAQQRAYDRGQLCLQVKQALEIAQQDPGTEATRGQLQRAHEAVQAEVQQLFREGLEGEPDPAAGTVTDPQAAQARGARAIESIRARSEESWLQVLVLFGTAIYETGSAAPGSEPSQTFASAYEVARRGVDTTAEISPPGKFDRATQWMFILCLPFAPYFLWALVRERRRVFSLDEETLVTPEETWPRDEIDDIDMGRWMAKSVAHVVHRDGRRVKLDDYVHRNTHLIVGALASERYPEAWDAEARVRTTASADEPEDEGEPEGEGAADPVGESAART